MVGLDLHALAVALAGEGGDAAPHFGAGEIGGADQPDLALVEAELGVRGQGPEGFGLGRNHHLAFALEELHALGRAALDEVEDRGALQLDPGGVIGEADLRLTGVIYSKVIAGFQDHVRPGRQQLVRPPDLRLGTHREQEGVRVDRRGLDAAREEGDPQGHEGGRGSNAGRDPGEHAAAGGAGRREQLDRRLRLDRGGRRRRDLRRGLLTAAELRLLLHLVEEVLLELVQGVGAEDGQHRDGDLLVGGVVAQQDLQGLLDLLLIGELADQVRVGAQFPLELGHAGLVQLAGQERVDELFIRHAFSVAILSCTQSLSCRRRRQRVVRTHAALWSTRSAISSVENERW